MIRVRQTIPHVIIDIEGVKPSPMPPKVFTTSYPAIKYPYSVIKHKAYSYFGLDLEEEVAIALKCLYKDKFKGDVPTSDRKDRFSYLSAKDMTTYMPLLYEYIKGIVKYFLLWYPPSHISHISYQDELTLIVQRDEVLRIIEMDKKDGTLPRLSGHPDIVVWLDDKDVIIYDIKVFARTNASINKDIRLQICSYAVLARSMGLQCNHVGVIMPWGRSDEPVKDFDISKWKDNKFFDSLVKSIPKVLHEGFHYLKWSMLLHEYSVGSHIHRQTAINMCQRHTPDPPVKIPFQIFLYGNNPSSAMEAKEKAEIARLKPDFSKNNIFVHAPYNITLCSPALYIVSTIKTYLNDAHAVGAKGVVFHTGHHPDEKEGLKIMKKNMTAILGSIRRETPLIIETPCGNKNEMLNTATKFSDFLMLYPQHLVGACVDTCHVYVSGENPMEYIRSLGGYTLDPETGTNCEHPPIDQFVPTAADRICLIHFNGSRKKIGCCADGHAHVTTINNIPDDELEGVLLFARQHNIPCVTE
jgi:endonuclease IV